ncbi:MAG: hypothetical protein ACODAD_11290 [Planctomycetota bacterium]
MDHEPVADAEGACKHIDGPTVTSANAHRTACGGGAFAEIGFVFGRELQYEEDPLDLSFDDTFILRTGITY